MTPQEKLVARLFMILMIICPIVLVIHYAIFPEETKCILVDSQGFEEKGNIYFSDSTTEASVDHLQQLIDSASDRVAKFWGEKKSDPNYIYLESDNDYAGYCKDGAPAVTYLKMGSHIVLSRYGANTDIIAHEIAHAELYERIGFFKWTFSIPMWFKQGLAMQVDNRIDYSTDSLDMLITGLEEIPDIKQYDNAGSFYYGDYNEVRLHYILAKLEINAWYTPEKLAAFISDINDGKSFYEAYGFEADPTLEMPIADSVGTETSTEPEAVEPSPTPVTEETMTLQVVPVEEENPVEIQPKKEKPAKKKNEEEGDTEFKTAKPEDFFPKQ